MVEHVNSEAAEAQDTIKRAVELAGSQRAAAERLGVPRATLQRILAGEAIPGADALARARALVAQAPAQGPAPSTEEPSAPGPVAPVDYREWRLESELAVARAELGALESRLSGPRRDLDECRARLEDVARAFGTDDTTLAQDEHGRVNAMLAHHQARHDAVAKPRDAARARVDSLSAELEALRAVLEAPQRAAIEAARAAELAAPAAEREALERRVTATRAREGAEERHAAGDPGATVLDILSARERESGAITDHELAARRVAGTRLARERAELALYAERAERAARAWHAWATEHAAEELAAVERARAGLAVAQEALAAKAPERHAALTCAHAFARLAKAPDAVAALPRLDVWGNAQ